jgi:hypothetical protein
MSRRIIGGETRQRSVQVMYARNARVSEEWGPALAVSVEAIDAAAPAQLIVRVKTIHRPFPPETRVERWDWDGTVWRCTDSRAAGGAR